MDFEKETLKIGYIGGLPEERGAYQIVDIIEKAGGVGQVSKGW